MSRKRKKNILKMKINQINNDLIIDSALDSKIHGLSNIIRTNSLLLKLIWISAFTICSSYCIYQIIVTSIQFSTFGGK